MRAIQIAQFGNPGDVLRVDDLPEPAAPGAGGVKVAVELSPLNLPDLRHPADHSFERSEVWSDGGVLLATAELVRKHPSAGHRPDPNEERSHEH
jgi:hypothetical protein